jgi:hypothetical protein
LIQIWTYEIEKVIKEEKSNIIDFNNEKERMEIPKEIRKVGEKL